MTTAERDRSAPLAGSPLRSPSPLTWAGRLAPSHRDGLALILSSGLTSAVGLLYRVLAARLFDPATLGSTRSRSRR